MNNETIVRSSTWKRPEVPRGSQIARHNKTALKTTVSLYLDKKLVENARNHSLNLSKVTEQALSSILDYIEIQNHENNPNSLNKISQRQMSGGPNRIRTGDLLHVKQMS